MIQTFRDGTLGSQGDTYATYFGPFFGELPCVSWEFAGGSSPGATLRGARRPLQVACRTNLRHGRRVRLADFLAIADVAVVEVGVPAFSGVTLASRYKVGDAKA